MRRKRAEGRALEFANLKSLVEMEEPVMERE